MSAIKVTLLAFAAESRAAAPLLVRARRLPPSIDLSCLHGAQQQTRRTPRLWWNDGRWDIQTDRRTLDRFIDAASPSVRALSVSWKQSRRIRHGTV